MPVSASDETVTVVKLTGRVHPQCEQERLWKGAGLTTGHYDRLLQTSTDVLKPNGQPLIQFRKGVIPRPVCERAYGALRLVRGDPGNRKTAAVGYSEIAVRTDGTVSKQNRLRLPQHPELKGVHSGIIGFMNREGPQRPYCRLTAFNLDHPELFGEALDYIQAVSRVFERVNPRRYRAQLAVIARTQPDYVIGSTAFTTITVNKNFRTFCHLDAGDLKAGFGVMAVLQGGAYTGCYTVFPEYRVAVDMRMGDVLLADVHEWHGNTPLRGRAGGYERISCVFYYREKMIECLSLGEELQRARRVANPTTTTTTAAASA